MAIPPGDGQFTHLEFAREPDRSPPRKRQSAKFPRPPVPTPPDIRQHGERISREMSNAVLAASRARQESGVSPARLVVVEFDTINNDARQVFEEKFRAHVVAESIEKQATTTRYRTLVQFPNTASLDSFNREIGPYQRRQSRKGTLASVEREQFFNAIQSVRALTAEERTGSRLKAEGIPDSDVFFLDVDLWRPENPKDATTLLNEFTGICQSAGGRVTSRVQTESLLLLKVSANRALAEKILDLDLVAHADLPPKLAAGYANIFQTVPPLNMAASQPDSNDPLACVLDSGVVSGHPLLSGWVMEERDFDTGEGTETDRNGHGTSVSGLVVYGDIAACLETNYWQPKVRICSAKVLRNELSPLDPANPGAEFPDRNRVEQITEQAIRYFNEQWGCRIFNLSVGDDSEPYRGGRQFP